MQLPAGYLRMSRTTAGCTQALSLVEGGAIGARGRSIDAVE